MKPQSRTLQGKPTDFSSPKQKRLKVTSFTVNEQNMVINTYKYIKETWPTDKYPYRNEIIQATASILGISVASLYRILRDYTEHGQVSSPISAKTRPTFDDKIDDATKSAIRKKVYNFFLNGDFPTLDKVLNDINEDNSLPNFKRTTFQRILKHLKFQYIRRHRNNVLTDRNYIVLWRQTYLRKIKEYRETNRRIFYMDETWVNAGHIVLESLNKGAKNPTSKARILIIVHIGNEDGFLEGGSWVFESNGYYADSHELMDAVRFENWFERVLAKLGENAVVVMDNAPYHSRRKEKIPKLNWLKVDIQQWLKDKNINFDESEIKVQLLEKVKEVKNQYQTYAVDELAKKYGVEILRLPQYHGELNPIELIWDDIKGYVARNNISFKFEKVKELINDGIASVTPDQWRKCVEHVKKEEEKFYKLDYIVDDVIDNLSTCVTDSDSESTESVSTGTAESDDFD